MVRMEILKQELAKKNVQTSIILFKKQTPVLNHVHGLIHVMNYVVSNVQRVFIVINSLV